MATIIIGNVSMVSDGDYVASSSHNKNHYVYVLTDNITYVSLLDNNTTTPTNDHTNWQILCKGIGVTTDNNYTNAEKTKLVGIEILADVTDANNVGIAISGSTAKATPVDADTVGLIDSTSSNVLSKLTWSNIKATLKTYFDILYNLYIHPTGDGNLHVPVTSNTNNGKVLKAGSTAGNLSWGTLSSSDTGSVPTTTTVNGLALSSDITHAQLVATGIASGDVSGNALNALSLGGNLASLYPTILSGNFTPTVHGSTTAGSPTFSTSPTGAYFKIGRLVIIELEFQLSSKGGMAGNVIIGALPFTATAYGSLCITSANGFTSAVNNVTIQEVSNNIVLSTVANVSDTAAIYASTGFYLA